MLSVTVDLGSNVRDSREIVMRRIAIGLLLVAMGVCVGCEKDFYARQIIEYNTDSGRLLLNLTGTAEQLLKRKRIDAHRSITVADGTKIDVWVLKAKRDRGSAGGTALLLHGLGESKAKYLRAGEHLAKMGYDVVLPDLRAHGRSGGKYVTYGALEKLDVKAVMDDLIGSGTVHKNVYVFGVTLGAATAIQYGSVSLSCGQRPHPRARPRSPSSRGRTTAAFSTCASRGLNCPRGRRSCWWPRT